jgi:hypothetical protein
VTSLQPFRRPRAAHYGLYFLKPGVSVHRQVMIPARWYIHVADVDE